MHLRIGWIRRESCGPLPLSGDSAPSSEAELLRRVLAGERELFHELVWPYERSVYFAAYSVLQNEHDAQDAAQEAMLKALRNLPVGYSERLHARLLEEMKK